MSSSSDRKYCGEGETWAVDARTLVGSSPGLRAALVAFPPGTRTHWHTHEEGQVLWIVSGEGWLHVADGEPTRLRPGRAYDVGGHLRHWHGAVAGTWLEHVAVTLGKTVWEEPSDYPDDNQ
jgi:quercetin dioxygenase-like cupin family protein